MGTNEKKRLKNFKQIVFLILLAVLAVLAAVQYSRRSHEVQRVAVSFVNPDGSRTTAFHLEVAASEQDRRKGLMFRKAPEMAADQGMLFVFPREDKQLFWMKDTYIPLDIIFLDRNLKVVGVLSDVPVLNEERRGVDGRSQFVVELLAGTARRHKISAGSVANIPAEALQPG